MRRAAFLLGSGVSLKSGAPTVKDITSAILSGGWRDEGDFRFARDGKPPTGTAQQAQQFLHAVKGYLDPHLRVRENRESHYEDLYAAATQIFQDEIREIVDPMIRGSASEIQVSVENLFRGQDAGKYPSAFARLVHSGTLLIHWGGLDLLKPVQNPIGIEVLGDVAAKVQEMDIFTLNHDCLIERQLGQAGIPFSDGFSEVVGDVRRFDWSWNGPTRVRVYKLHGSIDWYRFGFPDGVVQFGKVPLSLDPAVCRDSNGNELKLLNPLPCFLIGTTGKERLYGVGFVGEFFLQFHSRLGSYQTVICSGYGWGDKGINNRLNQWLLDNQRKRIVILHKNDPNELKAKHFWSKGSRWEHFEQSGKLVIVRKWLSECTLNDLEPFFDS